MRSSWQFVGLGSRVATRTFLIFTACLSLPAIVAAFALNAYVSRQAEHRAHEELLTRAKNYGFLLFERLKDTEEDLGHSADLLLQGKLSSSQFYALTSKRFHVTRVTNAVGVADANSSAVTLDGSNGGIRPVL